MLLLGLERKIAPIPSAFEVVAKTAWPFSHPFPLFNIFYFCPYRHCSVENCDLKTLAIIKHLKTPINQRFSRFRFNIWKTSEFCRPWKRSRKRVTDGSDRLLSPWGHKRPKLNRTSWSGRSPGLLCRSCFPSLQYFKHNQQKLQICLKFWHLVFMNNLCNLGNLFEA